MAPTTPPMRSQESLPESFNNALASPPYERQNPHEAMPPIYASQSNLAAQSSQADGRLVRDAAIAALASGDVAASERLSQDNQVYLTESKPTQAGPLDHSILTDSTGPTTTATNSNTTSRPGTAGPRIAITDPLADFRDRNLSKPPGLVPKSEFAPHETSRTPGAFNYSTNVP